MDVAPRYSIISPLTEGGMAQICLATLNGPEGFERVVVLKHVLAEYESDSDFVDMFLDEARLIAKIRHPNVVQVHDLGRDSSGLFLAMEYLHGENARSLLAGLRGRGLQLDPLLACHIVAEAAAGLQAAHELTDRHGRKETVVHRDISPDNLFLTYDGDVKVIDFGIAQSSRARGRTEPGVVRGKAAYMSPEQVLGRDVDRRTDIFALGIVLWELLTTRRLFRRETMQATWDAVLDDPISDVGELVSGCPVALAAVCRRALQRDVGARYPTAEAMRKDLVAVLLAGGLTALPRDSLASLMRELFVEERVRKDGLLGQASVQIPVRDVSVVRDAKGQLTGTHPASPRAIQTDKMIAEPTEAPRPETDPVGLDRVISQSGAPLRSPTRTGTVAAVAVIAGAAFIGAWAIQQRRPRQLRVEAPVARVVAPPSPVPSETAGPTSPATVSVRIVSTPPGASVSLEGHPRGVTPIELTLDRGEGLVELELRLHGYQTLLATAPHDRDRVVELRLVPVHARPQKRQERSLHRFE